MTYTHALLTRPSAESRELARLLVPLGLRGIVQPAFDYLPVNAAIEQPEVWKALESATAADLVVFTSPRAVAHGLAQLPPGCNTRAAFAAVGPATTRALEESGVKVGVHSPGGYTSEALLETVDAKASGRDSAARRAFILAAPGGRDALEQGLRARGWMVYKYLVYRSEPAELDREQLARLADADGLLAVWTSGNAMNSLAQRLSPSTWRRICSGDWLVISERLRKLARSFRPQRIHLASGPGNDAILASIRDLL
ncbi:MAG: uroporphyrinogen-III synthase [Lysobacterales bacterium]|jgi:uroporphyrinogen-III synthase